MEELNQSLRQSDKVKDDAIAQLSDQLCLYHLDYRKSKGDRTLARAMLCINQELSI
ncbi:MAG TPA: hypothetical protein VH796_12000 [Nitrososphaeraceae archaeon]